MELFSIRIQRTFQLVSTFVDKLQIELPFLQKGTVSQKHGTATRLSILREPVTTGGDTCYFLEKHTEALHIRIA